MDIERKQKEKEEERNEILEDNAQATNIYRFAFLLM